MNADFRRPEAGHTCFGPPVWESRRFCGPACAPALKPVVLPGEPLHVHIVKEGKEASQGVAYLDDGTMVVVEHGKRLIGQTARRRRSPPCYQTAAGRMIFARPRDDRRGRDA